MDELLRDDPLWIGADKCGNVYLFGYEPEIDEEFEEFVSAENMMFLGEFAVPWLSPGGKSKVFLVRQE